LEFNVPFQHKYGYIRDNNDVSSTVDYDCHDFNNHNIFSRVTLC